MILFSENSPLPTWACVWVFVGGSGQYMPNSNGNWALFSLEVKTQTKTKNAKGHATVLSSSVYLLNNNNNHHTAAGRDKQRDAQGDRQAGGKTMVNSMLWRPSVLVCLALRKQFGILGNTLICFLADETPLSCLYGEFKKVPPAVG